MIQVGWNKRGSFLSLFLFLYNVYQCYRIIINYHHYEVFVTVIDKPSFSYLYRNVRYYTITFEIKEGITKTLNVKQIWSLGLFVTFDIDNYNNRKINILYNKESDTVMYISLVNREKLLFFFLFCFKK